MMRGGKSRSVVCAVVVVTLWGLIPISPASATITAIGDIAPLCDDFDLWNVSGDLVIGAIADANLVISGGSRVKDDRGFIGLSSSEFVVPGVTVTGAGSLWQNGSNLVIGGVGRGMLIIENGGRVTSPSSSVASGANSSGMVRVTGSGSGWDSDVLRVGEAGIGTVYIEDGGRVTSHTAVLEGGVTAAGSVLVTGENSVWENLADPNTGLGGDLSIDYVLGISSGGRVVSRTATINGEVVVSSEDTLWENQSHLEIAQTASGRLWIMSGGTVATPDAVAGVEAGSEGVITVEGAGSALEISGDLTLGGGGNTNLSISGGGQVSAADVTLASDAGSIASATITGENSLLTAADHLNIGGGGDADMVISNGGCLLGVAVVVAADSNGAGTVAVTGAGSRLTAVNLNVGEYGHGSVTVSDGGVASAMHTIWGVQAGSIGSAVVTGKGSAWNNMGILDVGYAGDGQVTLSDGGQMSSATGRIGVLAGGRGVVALTDANSLWTNSGALYIGGDETHAAGTGALILGEGTRVASNSIRVWNTGSLQGAGTVAADVVVEGTVRPGNSIGTLTIDGDVTFDPCSVLEVEIASAAADKLAVTGDVEIAGGTVRSIATETIVGSHQYVIVEANSVSGQFDALDTALVDSFILLESAELGYQSDAVVLAVTATDFDDPNIVRTGNQASLGSALQQVAEEGGNGVTTALQQLQTGGAVEAAYNQLSGQTTPSLAPVTVAGTTRHVGAIAGRLRNPAGGVAGDEGFGDSSMAFAAGDTMSPDAGRYLFSAGNGTPVLGDKPWGVWGKGYGLYGDRETGSGVPGYQYTIYGTAFGLDYRFTERLLLGFTMGYSQGDIDYSDSRDSSDVSATHAGVYGCYDTPHWYLDSILTYTDLEYETRRYVDLLDERLKADPSGDMLTAYFEAGLNWRRGERTLIQPLAGLQLSTLKIDGFTETGGDSALTFDDQRYDSYKGSLGARLTQQLFERENGSRMELELRGRWVHEFGDTTASLDAGFASDPGATFRVSDGDIARDSAVLGAGLDTWFTRQTRLFVDYGTELNPDNTIQVVTAGLEHRW